MARKVFLSFLGVTNYSASKYYIDDKEPIETRFVQIASLQFHCSDFDEKDKILIFTTDTAKERNWRNYTWEKTDFKTCEKYTEETKGLKELLEKLTLKSDFESVWIPEETSENKIWEMFDIVFNELETEDEIVFDITHGFRSSPMFLMVLINYAKFLQNINVRKIVYGAYEARDKKTNKTQIWDLTNFTLLQDWTNAIGSFLKFGDSEQIRKLTKTYAASQKNKQIYEKYANQFEKVTNSFLTIRGKNIINGELFTELLNYSENLVASTELPMLKQLFAKVAQNISNFQKDDIQNGFRAIDWIFNHKLIQQSYTLLQEMVKTCLCELWKQKYSFDYKKIDDRELISSAISVHTLKGENNPDNWHGALGKRKELGKKVFDEPIILKLSKTFAALTQSRNSMNHGGFTDNKKGNEFYKNFKKYYKQILDILSKYGIYYQSKILS